MAKEINPNAHEIVIMSNGQRIESFRVESKYAAKIAAKKIREARPTHEVVFYPVEEIRA